MRNVVMGSFVGFVLAAAFLAACGSSGPSSSNATLDQLAAQVALLQQEVADLTDRLDAHTADTTVHQPATPWLGLGWCIALEGIYPSRSLVVPGEPGTDLSADPLVGGLGLFAGDFAPRGWAFCQGQLLPISQHTALFSLIGATYGGDGVTTFALPDLRGRTPVGVGTGPGLPAVALGQTGP